MAKKIRAATKKSVLIRHVDDDLWLRLGQRAESEGRTRQWVIHRLVQAYALGEIRIGLLGVKEGRS